ncbi:MAG: cytochrome b [bacterium]
MSSPNQTYTKGAIILHWFIAILLIGQLAGGLIMHKLDPSDFKYSLYGLHKSFGVIILFLSCFRLFWRFTHKVPAAVAGMADWEKLVTKLTHSAFYILMITIPLAGWAMSTAHPKAGPIKLFNIIPWPGFPGIGKSEALKDFFAETHEYLAYAMIALIVLHIAAAIRHHYQLKDEVLTRMVPFLKIRR